MTGSFSLPLLIATSSLGWANVAAGADIAPQVEADVGKVSAKSNFLY
jgi:hypothetical protein